jgi:hypothetical protein
MFVCAVLEKFKQEVGPIVPYGDEKDGKVVLVKATPLTDLTFFLKEVAKSSGGKKNKWKRFQGLWKI